LGANIELFYEKQAFCLKICIFAAKIIKNEEKKNNERTSTEKAQRLESASLERVGAGGVHHAVCVHPHGRDVAAQADAGEGTAVG
jgi:hypothetical protein